MNYLYQTVQSFVSWGIDTGINYIITACSNITITPRINTCILFTVFGFSKIQTKVYNFMKIQKQNIGDWIKINLPAIYIYGCKCIRACNYIQTYLYSCIYKNRIEPLELEWSNFSSIDETITSQYINSRNKYSETYNFIHPDQDNALLFNTLYLEATTKQFLKNNSNHNNLLLTAKIDKHYLYRTLPTGLTENKLFALTQSTVKFLSITYTHPSLENAIHIDIPKNALICGNEILSSVFVLRYLEYQSMPYGQFDLDYSINIIDNFVNQLQIRSNQYIVLLENKYTICTV